MMRQSTTSDDRLSILSPEEIEKLEGEVSFHRTPRGTLLARHEYGDPNGRPLFFFHGTGSHVHGMLLHKPGLEYGFRIIAPDRPGVGRSDYRPGWTVLEFAQDVADLADCLGLERFGIIGISGAGPSLMAAALSLPERLCCVVDLACAMPVYADPEMAAHLGTMDRVYAMLGCRLPLALFRVPFWVLGFMQKAMKSPKSFARMFDSSLCAADKELFRLPDMQYLFMRDMQELFRSGATGPAYDAQTVYLDWGFHLADITAHIEVFQGTDDIFIPPQFSEYLCRKARDAHLDPIPGQGHFCHLAYGYRTLRKVNDLYRA